MVKTTQVGETRSLKFSGKPSLQTNSVSLHPQDGLFHRLMYVNSLPKRQRLMACQLTHLTALIQRAEVLEPLEKASVPVIQLSNISRLSTKITILWWPLTCIAVFIKLSSIPLFLLVSLKTLKMVLLLYQKLMNQLHTIVSSMSSALTSFSRQSSDLHTTGTKSLRTHSLLIINSTMTTHKEA